MKASRPDPARRRLAAGLGLAGVGAALLPRAVRAQGTPAWPTRAVTVIVPFPPGGGADALMRIMQPSLSRLWGQPVVVDNRPGAAGALGAELVARAAPDGHTLMMSSAGGVTQKNAAQFAPVTLVSASAYVLAAGPKLPGSTVRELLEHARRHPGQVSFGSSGVGAASHLAGELFRAMAGVDLLHVPYKGTGQAVSDLLGGQIDLVFAPAQAVMPQVAARRLKALAVTSAQRSAVLPGLPTVAEAGVPGYDAVGWFGLFAPVATPRELVARLSADANRVLAEAEVQQKILALGAEVSGGTPEQFARFAEADRAKWARLIRERGIVLSE